MKMIKKLSLLFILMISVFTLFSCSFFETEGTLTVKFDKQPESVYTIAEKGNINSSFIINVVNSASEEIAVEAKLDEDGYKFVSASVKDGQETTSITNDQLVQYLTITVEFSCSEAGAYTGSIKVVDKASKASQKLSFEYTVYGKEDYGKLFAGGRGTEEDPYLICDYQTMQNITKLYEAGYHYFKVDADKCTKKNMAPYINCSGWTPVYLNGSFDGSGIKFDDVTAVLFQTVGYKLENVEITLSNFEATMNVSANGSYGAAALIKNIFNAGTTTFDSVNVHGKIEGYWNLGSYYNYGPANYDDKGCDYTVNFINCKSDATLICSSGNTCGGFLGHGYEGNNHTEYLNIDENSEYTGTIYTTGGNGGHYIAMNSTGRLVFNGVETSTHDSEFTTYSNNKKIEVKTPYINTNVGEEGYYVELSEGAEYILVSITCQMDAYDGEEEIANLSGITMVLTSSKIEAISKVLAGVVNSADICNGADSFGYSLSEGVMTLYIASDAKYKTGTVRLQVAQYDANDNILSCGTINLYTIKLN